jgi:hypothetical protein
VNVGFDASEGAAAVALNEKPPEPAAGLVSDCEAGGLNKSPLGALAVVEGPNVNPAGFSVVEEVDDELNANTLLAGVEGAAAVVRLAN